MKHNPINTIQRLLDRIKQFKAYNITSTLTIHHAFGCIISWNQIRKRSTYAMETQCVTRHVT